MCVGIPNVLACMGVLTYGFGSGHEEQEAGVGIGAFWGRVKVQRHWVNTAARMCTRLRQIKRGAR